MPWNQFQQTGCLLDLTWGVDELWLLKEERWKKHHLELHNQWGRSSSDELHTITQLFFFFLHQAKKKIVIEYSNATRRREAKKKIANTFLVIFFVCAKDRCMCNWLPTESADWHLAVHSVAGGEEVKEGEKPPCLSLCVWPSRFLHTHTHTLIQQALSLSLSRFSPLWRFNTLTRCVSMRRREENEKRRLTAPGKGKKTSSSSFFLFRKKAVHTLLRHWPSCIGLVWQCVIFVCAAIISCARLLGVREFVCGCVCAIVLLWLFASSMDGGPDAGAVASAAAPAATTVPPGTAVDHQVT